MPNGAQEAVVVKPPDPLQRRELDVFHILPRPQPSDDFRFEQADDGLGQGIVVRVADAAHGGFDSCFRQPLRVANTEILPRFKGSSQRMRFDGSLGSPVLWMVRGQGRGRPGRTVLLMLPKAWESEATEGRRSAAADAMRPS